MNNLILSIFFATEVSCSLKTVQKNYMFKTKKGGGGKGFFNNLKKSAIFQGGGFPYTEKH